MILTSAKRFRLIVRYRNVLYGFSRAFPPPVCEGSGWPADNVSLCDCHGYIWLDYHCTYGVIDGHVLKQALTTLVASRVAAQPHD